ncbi:A1S_2505 family phage non-structural protein [Paramicrobacterium agarici]|uniref:A1S_2505 family phage non-structural protein n=1 Tax=Paramicrobacterium agarici TaxID=630514 RepID=UPI001169AD45|nr:methyltransferase domain-containing protein [Microbacterium agarici]TQO23767.1 methyltransferase family protein [Microbacterium agarici]
MHIESLKPGEIFVFGSNASGAHGAGAALTAYEKFGAVWGQGSGLQGQSYGIDTMSGIDVMRREAAEFVAFARQHPNLTFLLTPVGCGIAGFAPGEVAPLFADAPHNVVLPESFREVIGAPDAAARGGAEHRQEYWDNRYGERERMWSGRVNGVLADIATPLQPGTALDLGCGEGADSLWLAERGWTVTGVDVSAVALERAAGEARARGTDAVTWQHADLETWKPDGSFDLVSACFLQAPEDFGRAGVLHRTSRHVRQGGHMLIVSHAAMPPWSHHHDHADMPTLQSELAAVGADADWDVVVAETRGRQATSPDGDEVTVDDNVVLLRRR